ncbi:MAG TPA: hypothetical protein VH575_14020, partial [Gemmataceae bacterium]
YNNWTTVAVNSGNSFAGNKFGQIDPLWGFRIRAQARPKQWFGNGISALLKSGARGWINRPDRITPW